MAEPETETPSAAASQHADGRGPPEIRAWGVPLRCVSPATQQRRGPALPAVTASPAATTCYAGCDCRDGDNATRWRESRWVRPSRRRTPRAAGRMPQPPSSANYCFPMAGKFPGWFDDLASLACRSSCPVLASSSQFQLTLKMPFPLIHWYFALSENNPKSFFPPLTSEPIAWVSSRPKRCPPFRKRVQVH